MKVTIEKIDDKHYIVRCVEPANPPFKGTTIHGSIERALDMAGSMLAFPGHFKSKHQIQGHE